MSAPTPTPDIGIIGTSRRLSRGLGLYVIALLMLTAFFTGSLVIALFTIAAAELLSLWRPTPKLGPASYSAPMPAGLQTPMRVLRWYQAASGCWSVVVGGVIATVVCGIILVELSRRPLGPGNYAVAALVAAWLLTRPLWYPALEKRFGKALQGVQKELAGGSPSVLVGLDGIDINLKVRTIGANPNPQRPWLFHVAFAEIEEVRTLSSLDAQAYWQSMQEYDPSLDARMGLEVYQYIQGRLPRPSIFQTLAAGTHLLIRGPSLLYLLGWADESGPAVVAAWNAWRGAHPLPAGRSVLPAP